MTDTVFCFDFGAGSVRLMAVVLAGKQLQTHEIARFANEPQNNEVGELCWQHKFWREQMRTALAEAFSLANGNSWQVLSLGIDTWGADMAYFTQKNTDEYELLQAPYCYRDERMKSSIETLHNTVPQAEIYRSGGNAYFPFNSIYQLHHDYHYNFRTKHKISKFLFTPDYLCYLLTGSLGEFTAEYCIASTSGFCDARKRNWNWNLIDKAELPHEIFPRIVEAPYFSGMLSKKFGKNIPVIKVAAHDTASAVSIAALSPQTCYLNCGTWFLMGIESPEPCLSDAAFAQEIVNEGNPSGQQRIMKMFCGFWLLQQLHKEWNAEFNYAELSRLARKSRLNADDLPEFDVNNASLSFPESMHSAITALLPARSYQKRDLLRIVYYNMARACRHAIHSISQVSGRDINEILMLGGGSQDSFFLTELQRICEKKIQHAAIEASVLGNAGMQFLYHKKVENLKAYHQIVRSSAC